MFTDFVQLSKLVAEHAKTVNANQAKVEKLRDVILSLQNLVEDVESDFQLSMESQKEIRKKRNESRWVELKNSGKTCTQIVDLLDKEEKAKGIGAEIDDEDDEPTLQNNGKPSEAEMEQKSKDKMTLSLKAMRYTLDELSEFVDAPRFQVSKDTVDYTFNAFRNFLWCQSAHYYPYSDEARFKEYENELVVLQKRIQDDLNVARQAEALKMAEEAKEHTEKLINNVNNIKSSVDQLISLLDAEKMAQNAIYDQMPKAIVVSGATGKNADKINGIFDPKKVDSTYEMVEGRHVYQMRGTTLKDIVLIFVVDRWQIQKERATGTNDCYAYCLSDCSFPHLCGEIWQIAVKDQVTRGISYQSAPQLTLTVQDSAEVLKLRDEYLNRNRFLKKAFLDKEQDSSNVNVSVVLQALKQAISSDSNELGVVALECVAGAARGDVVKQSALGSDPKIISDVMRLLISRFVDSPKIVEQGMQALKYLCINLEDQVVISFKAANMQNIRTFLAYDKSSAINKVVKCIKPYQANGEIMGPSMCFFASLVFNYPPCLVDMVNCDVHILLARTFSRHRTDISVMQPAAWALYNFCFNESVTVTVNAEQDSSTVGTPRQPNWLLEKFVGIDPQKPEPSDVCDIVVALAAILGKLGPYPDVKAPKGSEFSKDFVTLEGPGVAPKFLGRTVKVTKWDPVQRKYTVILPKLKPEDEEIERSFANQSIKIRTRPVSGGVAETPTEETTSDADMKKLAAAKEIQDRVKNTVMFLCWSISIIANLSTKGRQQLISKCACDHVFRAVVDYEDEPGVCDKAWRAVAALAKEKEGVTYFMDMSIGDCDIIKAATRALVVHKDVPEVVSSVSVAIASLSAQDSPRSKFGTGETVAAIVNALSLHKASSSVVEKVFHALANISFEQKYAGIVGGEDRCTEIISAFDAHVENLAVANVASYLLVNLSHDASVVSVLKSDTSASCIVKAMRCTDIEKKIPAEKFLDLVFNLSHEDSTFATTFSSLGGKDQVSRFSSSSIESIRNFANEILQTL